MKLKREHIAVGSVFCASIAIQQIEIRSWSLKLAETFLVIAILSYCLSPGTRPKTDLFLNALIVFFALYILGVFACIGIELMTAFRF